MLIFRHPVDVILHRCYSFAVVDVNISWCLNCRRCLENLAHTSRKRINPTKEFKNDNRQAVDICRDTILEDNVFNCYDPIYKKK